MQISVDEVKLYLNPVLLGNNNGYKIPLLCFRKWLTARNYPSPSDLDKIHASPLVISDKARQRPSTFPFFFHKPLAELFVSTDQLK